MRIVFQIMGSRIRENVKYLYECFCEVAKGDNSNGAVIVRKYPENYNDDNELKRLPSFVFASSFDNCHLMQHYSFILTSTESKFTFGFCRYDPSTQSALVLLSFLPWHDIFYKLLNCVAAAFQSQGYYEALSFLEACRKPPKPEHTLRIKYNAGLNASVFECKYPSNTLANITENYNLKEFFNALDTKCMIGLWAALLNERRVVVVASKLSRLSATVQAANSTLYPMTWQHIYIPILPRELKDYLQAPMPFLIGVPRNVLEEQNVAELGDIVLLDADSKILKTPFNDVESLPSDVISELKKSLSHPSVAGDFISRAFLKALVALIGGYMDAIRIETGKEITFDPEAFVKTRKNLQPFLRKILQLQIFEQFIAERLELLNSGRGFNDEFEIECCKYSDKTGSLSRMHQYKLWGKTFKREGGAIFKQVKDKFRQSGHTMKSAMMGLKKRLPKKKGSRLSNISSEFSSDRIHSGTTSPSSSSLSSQSSHSIPSCSEELPLDLLNELENLLGPQPNDSEKIMSLSRLNKQSFDGSLSAAPRPPARPPPPARYAVVPTGDLLSAAPPLPPPRPEHLARGTFISHITRDDINGSIPHTRPIQFTESQTNGGDKSRKFSLGRTSVKTNGILTASLSVPLPHSNKNNVEQVDRRYNTPRPMTDVNSNTNSAILKPKEVSESVSDLIKLDDHLDPSLDDFDPLKSSQRHDDHKLASADSALLQEYGIDFSRFANDDFFSMQPNTSFSNK